MSPTPLMVVASASRGPHWLERLLLPRGFAVSRATTQEMLVREVENSSPDLVSVDADLSGGGVLDTCKRLATLMGPITPVFVTGGTPFTRQQRLTLLDSGAWECVTPPIDTPELLLRVDTYVRAKRECDRIQSAGLTDPSTGLYNRQGLARRAREIGADAFRSHAPVASVVFAFEPREGSSLVTASVPGWAQVFRDQRRSSDAVARLGPDEVVVLAPDTDLEGARKLAQRYLGAISELVGDGGEPISVSAGYHAVANLGYTPTSPIDIVTQAAAAARKSAPGSPPACLPSMVP
ncbi:MAG: diguanylate cyclase domain-containing protein [Gemmatimonadales bacterium]